MDFKNLSISEKLVPPNYLKLAIDSQKSKETKTRELLEKRSLPMEGWSDDLIEYTVQQLANLDSNNFQHQAGLGEREGRIVCSLVQRRHYNFGHGIGRSGDLLEAQPKAVGSTILSKLTNSMLLDLMKSVGIRSCQSCFLMPMATSMTLSLCFLSLKKQRPEAKYIIWSRIDQKSCFKSMTTAGFTPIIINLLRKPESGRLFTDVKEFENKLNAIPAKEILCIMSTTSCFAPRSIDDIQQLAKLAEKYNVPHVINNAYGLQSPHICRQIEAASKGRVDLFVQSTDKNLMVPVGGAIVAGFNEDLVHNVAETYAGRASSSQTLDVFMTLLSLGKKGYIALCNERLKAYDILQCRLSNFANTHDCSLYSYTEFNPISMALFLNSQSIEEPTKLGAMLYTRGISGTRVIAKGSSKTIDGYEFKNWGSHEDTDGPPYLTAAASIGLKEADIDIFMKKLNECSKDISKKKKSTKISKVELARTKTAIQNN